MKTYRTVGTFTTESDGRLSGHVMHIGAMRRDGRTPVMHVFGSGCRVNELLTAERLKEEVAKICDD